MGLIKWKMEGWEKEEMRNKYLGDKGRGQSSTEPLNNTFLKEEKLKLNWKEECKYEQWDKMS